MTLYNRGRSMTQFSSGCWASPCTYVSLLCLNVQIRARPPCAQQLLAVYTRYKLVIKKTTARYFPCCVISRREKSNAVKISTAPC